MEDLGISPDYDNIFFFLSEQKVEYLIIGGVAVRYYIKDREARDLDILINNNSSNIMSLRHALHSFIIDKFVSQESLSRIQEIEKDENLRILLSLLSEENVKKLENLRSRLSLKKEDINILNGMDIFTPTKPNIFNEIYARKNLEYIRNIPIVFPCLTDLIQMKKDDDIDDKQKKKKNLNDIQLLEEKLLGNTSN